MFIIIINLYIYLFNIYLIKKKKERRKILFLYFFLFLHFYMQPEAMTTMKKYLFRAKSRDLITCLTAYKHIFFISLFLYAACGYNNYREIGF